VNFKLAGNLMLAFHFCVPFVLSKISNRPFIISKYRPIKAMSKGNSITTFHFCVAFVLSKNLPGAFFYFSQAGDLEGNSILTSHFCVAFVLFKISKLLLQTFKNAILWYKPLIACDRANFSSEICEATQL
jgi:hypothetical protein